MPEIAFDIPSGIYHTGTERTAAGRWYAGNLVRWTAGVLRPIYGWAKHSASAVTGSAPPAAFRPPRTRPARNSRVPG